MSRILARGPWTGQMLADLGAEVIKIETPPARVMDGPHLRPCLPEGPRRPTTPAKSCMYLSANRNKQSVTVDLATQEGQQVIRALAAKSDVGAGELPRRHAWAKIRARLLHPSRRSNPGLVYCSITVLRPSSAPTVDRPGYMTRSSRPLAGLMSVTGRRRPSARRRPE